MLAAISIILHLLVQHQVNKVVFDVKALKGKSITEIQQILGKPKINDIPLNYKTTSGALGDAFFEKEGLTLEVTYNITNRRVNDFFIGKDEAVSDYKMLEEAANVIDSDDFILYPIPSSKDKTKYSGVNITPK